MSRTVQPNALQAGRDEWGYNTSKTTSSDFTQPSQNFQSPQISGSAQGVEDSFREDPGGIETGIHVPLSHSQDTAPIDKPKPKYVSQT